MPRNPNRRRAIEAMAATGEYNPNEAANAASALARMDGADEDAAAELVHLSADIKEQYGKGIEAQFAIGRDLLRARELLPSNQAFGEWCDAQDFPFGRHRANMLQNVARHEPAVRLLLSMNNNEDPARAVRQVMRELAHPGEPEPPQIDTGISDGWEEHEQALFDATDWLYDAMGRGLPTPTSHAGTVDRLGAVARLDRAARTAVAALRKVEAL